MIKQIWQVKALGDVILANLTRLCRDADITLYDDLFSSKL